MEYRVLGSLEVVNAEGRTVALGGRQARALLAVLLLHANETVTLDVLVDELWGGDPPATASHVVQNLVSQLRKRVGDRLETRGRGYRLRVGPNELDLWRFQRLVEEAGRCRERAEATTAAAKLAEALALWRGAALADARTDELAPAARRLEELRLAAVEELTDVELELGRDGELVGELEQLVTEQPLRERLRGQLMLALYRAGRQAEALTVYRQGHAILADELGLEPSEELRQLERAILRHDPSLDARRADPAADAPATRRRRPPAKILALAGALLLVAAAAAAGVQLTRTGHSAAATVPPNSVALVDPVTLRVLATARVGSRPVAIAMTRGAAWIANADDGTVSRLDTTTRKVVRVIGVYGPPADLAAGDGRLWAVTGSEGRLVEIDPRTDNPVHRLDLSGTDRLMPHGAQSVAYGAGSVWVGSDANDGSLLRIDPRTWRVSVALSPGWVPAAVAFSDGAIWTAMPVGGAVRLEPGDGITASADVPNGISLAVGAGSVWVGQQAGPVWQLVPATAAVIRTIAVVGSPTGIAVGGGRVWVAGGDSGTLSEIDPRRGVVVRTLELGGSLLDVAYGAGGVWVAVAAASG